ncbi:DUF4407 domain-containing protein [Flagellimonas oceanensis]|uniref:DUF4407 domain-containing protein n=1 Tax=Flagellimonas oceanensis TaxID=2499163 RepID=UPI000F8F42CF|nr:DUF4407 domain-containing protein [Allomuricauda oceanensis]
MIPYGAYRFLWKVIGEDAQILRNCERKTQAVFALSGFLFSLFFIIGILSYRFIFNGIFKIPAISWPLALIWALIIFNIYRLNLSTLSANKPSYSFGYIVSLATRIVFMVLMGITLIKPFEAFIFNKSVSNGLTEVAMEKIEIDRGKYKTYFDIEIRNVENELTRLEQQLDYGRILTDGESFNFLNEKKLKLLNERDKTLAEAEELFTPTNLFFIGLLMFNKENPWIWLLTLGFLVAFLLPLFLKFSISPRGKYVKDSIDLQNRIILEEYEKFKDLYPVAFVGLDGSQVNWEENYEDSPFNTQRRQDKTQLGNEVEFLNQIHGH